MVPTQVVAREWCARDMLRDAIADLDCLVEMCIGPFWRHKKEPIRLLMIGLDIVEIVRLRVKIAAESSCPLIFVTVFYIDHFNLVTKLHRRKYMVISSSPVSHQFLQLATATTDHADA